MTFVYPAVFTPHEKDNGFHVEFPDLECCEAGMLTRRNITLLKYGCYTR